MITLSTTAAAIAGMVLAAWLGVAVWATAGAMRRRIAGEQAAGELARCRALLDSAPALPLIVAADGRISGGPRLAAWLGLDVMPRYLDELGGEGGLSAEALEALKQAVTRASRAATPFARELRLPGSQRILLAYGAPSPAGLAEAGQIVIWLFDASDSRREVAEQADIARRASAALEALSALIEAAPFPMWHRGPDLRLTLVNAAYVEAVEAANAAEVVARGHELVEQGGAESPQAIAAKVRDERIASVRTVPATLHGERRTLRIVDVPLGEAGVAGYAVDIEELEQARGDLARFVRAQRDMLDLLSAGVAQFGADRSLVFSNQPFSRMFAMKPEWLADRPEFDRVLERMREANRVPESRDFPAWKAERREWFHGGDEAFEENWLLPGGMHLRVVAQPIPDGGLLLIFEDRTEHAELASARDTLLQVRTATFDNLFEAIGVFAGDGRLHLWNSRFREIWELEEEELAGHPRVDALVDRIAPLFQNPERAARVRDLVRLATSERRQRTGRIALKDGRHFEIAAVPLPDGNALLTLLDTSDSKRMETALRERNEALEDADRLKTDFVSNMSYELRTPLTSIGGFAEMLDAGYAGALPDQAADYVKAILDSVAKLGAQIDDVLDLTQSQAGGLAMAEEEVDLEELCQHAADALRASAARRGHQFIVEIDWSVGSVAGDARRLRQSVDHLLRNAIAYTPEGGRVLLHAEGDEREARITVSDNGVGIAPRDQPRVFDRFQRAAAEGERALGLGLPLTKQYVELHGGKIALQSRRGMGTSVTIVLPRGRGSSGREGE